MRDAKILLIDIELAPAIGYTWGPKWETSIIEFTESWYILSIAYKWLGQSKIHVRALPDYPGYRKHKNNDRALVMDLYRLLNLADVICAHNGNSFDLRKSNSRLLFHGFPPPSSYKTIDTLRVARRHFGFNSNKLDDLCNELKIGRKVPHMGFNTWRGCMEGDPKSWRLLKRYNVHDVRLLEKLYLKVRPWASEHPKLNVFGGECPSCQSDDSKKDGIEYTASGERQRLKCLDCSKRWVGEKM